MGGVTYTLCPAILLLILQITITHAELTPPYFNLAEGRKITASATCGEGTDEPELYCKLVGANTENEESYYSLIQGQVCDYCDLNDPKKIHPIDYAIDGTENWWQSPPLSRGMKYNEVNLTIDFGQEFHVAYVFIRMGNSPRPGLWTLEKSSDYGKTWTSWQHFSDSPADCEIYFGKDSLKPITKDDDVVCTTEYSKIVPLENGEIPVMLVNNRPSANNYFNSTTLQEWTRATNIRIRLMRTKNLLGHLMSVARQDPTVTRRYFYSIKDISIGGRCMCNGHANTCIDMPRANTTIRLLACQCQHNTCGMQCENCCPGFEQKKWRQNTNARPFSCEPCNCFGHSNTCVYSEEIDEKGLSLDIHGNYEGGGVCQNCQHNTEGINCNKCKDTFYRPFGKHWNETDVCQDCNCNFFYSTGNCQEGSGRCQCRVEFQEPNCDTCSEGHFGYPDCRPCECNLNGTLGYHCEAEEGICPCKVNFGGNFCKECSEGYFSYPECIECNCNPIGSTGEGCDDATGQCQCLPNFAGKHCDQCKNNYYNYPECAYCKCDLFGTEEEVCDKLTGTCICKEGYGGPRCDQCLPRYYNFPNCTSCNCSASGSVQPVCDQLGKCQCFSNYAGKQCTVCAPGFYQYPECLQCGCDTHGSRGKSCNNEGQCTCDHNFDGKTCDKCKEGFYNFPACEECNCDPAGVIAKFAGCGSVPAGELCQCKERVQGRICNQCRPLYWNLSSANPHGCEECDCFIDGTIGGLDTCDTKSGQCSCKPHVNGRTCAECKDGTFDLFGSSLFGCKDCGCDVGGSADRICQKQTGQCKCHPRIAGRTCTRPVTTHYYPTLYQYQFEYEDGFTTTGAQVRYQFEEDIFPGFSKIGYAVFSPLQNEIFNEVNILKSSVYRLIIRYINPNSESVIGNILIQSDNPLDVDQKAQVLFKANKVPEFVTMSGAKGIVPFPVVLDPGRYTISITSDKTLFLDYFVLLPDAYYEASILSKSVENPCEIDKSDLCRHYKYPSIENYNPSSSPYIRENDKTLKVREFYDDSEHLSILGEEKMPLISESQSELYYLPSVAQFNSIRYVIVIDYITTRDFSEVAILNVQQPGDADEDGAVTLYPCLYTTVCRQVVIDKEAREKIFLMNSEDPKPIILSGETEHLAIKSVTAIPYESWTVDYIYPQPVCVQVNGECVKSSFLSAPDSKKIEFELDNEDRVVDNLKYISDNTNKVIYLQESTPEIFISSKVPEPGQYVIILKYYQPNHPKFDIVYRVKGDNQNYDGTLKLGHCPSASGCRVQIMQDKGSSAFDIDQTFNFTLVNIQPKGVWLDYVLLVPVSQFNENLLKEEDFDQTKEFIKQCGHDSFNIALNASDFCKQSVFSLTSEYNRGALPCACDYRGSTSFECEPFGGQCQCKANIIGRQCEACRTSYYGFPDCKPCDCPSTAICEKDTGDCICPPKVTGEKCDKCVPYTFGFDQIIGCEECNCNVLGVENGNLQCDLNNGSCICQPHVVGRTCEKCAYGFFRFPYCDACRCDLRGTTLEICDQDDETCFCKENVVGPECRDCKEGTYNLQEKNPKGCTKCFCFGKTTQCRSAFLRPFNVSMMKDVSLFTINTTNMFSVTKWDVTDNSIMHNETTAQVHLIELDNPVLLAGDVYFGMLDNLGDLHDHVTSYGEYLRYNVYYSTSIFSKASIAADVILEGKDLVLVYIDDRQPAPLVNFHGAVEMIETNFQTVTGASVTREQFMMVLRDLKKIYIRASYGSEGVFSSISDVFLTLANQDDDYSQYRELSVEECECPAGYTGFSCQDCAEGYYRIKDGPYGGYCVPCECNGHAKTCDCDTGICIDCEHSTTGDHCEMCIEGYYGNATYGSPYDCMICACPLPIESNNFAVGCEVSDDGRNIHCICKEGYAGHKCHYCASGYYGTPEIAGEFCKPCECSGNIDPGMPGSCDSVTGECRLCLNNTFGTACNLCAPGYYGDAIGAKDCQSCICDDVGTRYCSNTDGKCICLPNIEGEKCDRCVKDHFGFESGYGCTPCDCAGASNSTQCDDHTGQCACKYGVTGRHCDRCLPGFFDYPDCKPCHCNTNFSRGFGCNPKTGQCECLKDVVGERCNSCPPRWVFIDDYGCEECDGCHHGLLDVTDNLTISLDPVIEDFKTVAKSFYTTQKLKRLEEEERLLAPEVKKLDRNDVVLAGPTREIESLDMDSKNHKKKASYVIQSAKDRVKDSEQLIKDATDLLDAHRLVANTARVSIQEVNKLADNLETTEKGTKIDMAISEAEDYLDRIKGYIAESPSEPAYKLDKIIEDVDAFAQPVNEQNDRLNSLKEDLSKFDEKLEDLYLWSEKSRSLSAQAEALLKKNKASKLSNKFETVSNHSRDAITSIKEGDDLRKQASTIMLDMHGALLDAEKVLDKLKENNTNVENILPEREIEYGNMDDLIEQVQRHAEFLTIKAEDLTNQHSNITANSEDALTAATAYDKIENAVTTAGTTADEAKLTAEEAKLLTEGLDDKAGSSDQIARDLLSEARKSLKTVQQDLDPHLNDSSAKVKEIADLNMHSGDQLTAISLSLDSIKSDDSQKDVWVNARDEADEALENAKKALEILAPITQEVEDAAEKAKTIPNLIDAINKNTSHVSNAIERAGSMVPNIIALANDLEHKQSRLESVASDLGDKIQQLKENIEIARALANQIKVGVQFQPNTTLELKTPDNLSTMGTNTKVSTYFKTTNPNGLLFYLGNEDTQNAPRNKRNDFMAVEVENGYPVLTIDLGNGPERVINKKYVADGKWYQAIVDRSGNHINLIIREENENGEEQLIEEKQELTGSYSVFNIGPESRLFVGGSDVSLPSDVKQSSFEGQIEDFKIGDQDVGLWNFVDGQNNNMASIERDRLISKQTPSTGYRFGGNGYVILKAGPYNLRSRSNIQFKFKTSRDAPDGLIFYAGKGHHFITIELQNGVLLFQFKLGEYSDVVKIGSSNQFNDDQWHNVEASREKGVGMLRVDDQTIHQNSDFTVAEDNLEISDTLYFGGHPDQINHTDITKKHFDGCIDDVYIAEVPVDLTSNLKAYDVRPGCPTKFSSVLSFAPHNHGHLRKFNVSANNRAQINLKFKTKQPYGIIFYFSSKDQTSTFTLALEDGVLVLRSSREELNSGQNRYDNGEWHVVTATHDERKLKLSIDDLDVFESDITPPRLNIQQGEVYFGGLPVSYVPIGGAIASTAYFVGCISDVSINGQVVNFANSTDKKNAVLNNCHRDLFEYDPRTVPIYYPDGRVEEIVGSRFGFEVEATQTPDIWEVSEGNIVDIDGEGDTKKKDSVTVASVPVRPKTSTTTSTTTPATTTSTTVSTTSKRTRPITTRPTTKRPLPPDQICALPKKPHYSDVDSGYRFGPSVYNRIEVKIPSKVTKREYDFKFEFRTNQGEGVMFYASNPDKKDVIAVYLKDGKVHYVFNCGGRDTAKLVSNKQYTDDQWHTIEFTRHLNTGTLKVDQDDFHRTEINSPKTMEITTPYYFGGFDLELLEEVPTKLGLEESYFENRFFGCIDDIQLNKLPIDMNEDKFKMIDVLPCSEDVEEGVFFQDGLLKLYDKFTVGADLTVSMEIKPRTDTAILMSVHGRNAFFIVQLFNGTVIFSVDNGKGSLIQTIYKPDEDENLCDGQWHTVKAAKSAYVITVSVDDRSSEPGIGDSTNYNTQTTRPLFVGGHPHMQKIRGLIARKPYFGCIRNIKIRDKVEKIVPSMATGSIELGLCPTH